MEEEEKTGVLLKRIITTDRRIGEEVIIIGEKYSNGKKEKKDSKELIKELWSIAKDTNEDLKEWEIIKSWEWDDDIYIFASVGGNG